MHDSWVKSDQYADTKLSNGKIFKLCIETGIASTNQGKVSENEIKSFCQNIKGEIIKKEG